MDSGSNTHDHFIKQRRNLIAASLFVIFYEAGDFTIKEINILGNQAEIGNPDIVSFSLTVAFCYFLWRYYTACREIGGISRFFGACTNWAEHKCKQYVRKKYLSKDGSGATSIDLIERGNKELIYSFNGVPDSYGGHTEDGRVTVRWRFWIYSALSVFPVVLQTSNFTEYLLPYVLASLAVLEIFGLGIVSAFFS